MFFCLFFLLSAFIFICGTFVYYFLVLFRLWMVSPRRPQKQHPCPLYRSNFALETAYLSISPELKGMLWRTVLSPQALSLTSASNGRKTYCKTNKSQAIYLVRRCCRVSFSCEILNCHHGDKPSDPPCSNRVAAASLRKQFFFLPISRIHRGKGQSNVNPKMW